MRFQERVSKCGQVVLVLAVYTIATSVRADDALTQRFMTEAPIAWASYEREAQLIQGVHRLTITSSAGAAPTLITIHSKANSGRRLADVILDADGDSAKNIYAFNQRYAFSLTHNDEAGKWRFDAGARMDREPSQSQTIVDHANGYGASHTDFVMLDPLPLSELVQVDEFRVVSSEWEEIDGVSLVKIVFTSKHDHPEGIDDNPFQSGELWLDPDRFWILKRANGVQTDKAGSTVEISMEKAELDRSTEIPIPKHTMVRRKAIMTNPPSIINVVANRDYEVGIPNDLPADSEFTLTAYGLPELATLADQEVPPVTRWWLWISIAGLITVALGVLGFWAIRTRARSS